MAGHNRAPSGGDYLGEVFETLTTGALSEFCGHIVMIFHAATGGNISAGGSKGGGGGGGGHGGGH